jgi:hypothetical protein
MESTNSPKSKAKQSQFKAAMLLKTRAPKPNEAISRQEIHIDSIQPN